MQRIIWDGSLALGHEDIDRQHERLAGLINRLAVSWDAPDREHVVMQAITDMYLYANEHFREEEALMAATGYPGLEAHKAMHGAFVNRAHDFTDASLADASPFEELLDFLTAWFVGHVSVEDARMLAHALRKG